MNGSSDFARITSTLVLVVASWIAAFTAPVHCQEAQRFEPRAKTQLTAANWVPTGNLRTPRYGHTATLLANGKVLVVGGATNGSILDSAELYDPATGTWSVTGRLNAAHADHTATLLPNGQVLVVGGVNIVNVLDNAELYDPSTGTWSRTSTPTTYRFDHTATLLQTGKVLVAGGAYGGFVQIAALYDPVTGTWSSAGGLITPRALHQATLLHDGRVLVTGGSNDSDFVFPLSAAELYDPVAGTWSPASSLNTARDSHAATVLPNGSVLVAGGNGPPTQIPPGCATKPGGPCSIFDVPTNTAELFDSATGQWSNTGVLNAARVGHTATLLPGGEVLVAGGLSPAFDSGVPFDSAELFDQSTAKWVYARSLNTARSSHTATLLPNGQVLVAGGGGGELGTSNFHLLNSAELYGLAPAPGTIGAGFTGAWYDPSQSGHGLFIEVLPDSRFYAAWFAFNPAGTQQAWFTGVGTYSGNTATITAVEQPAGGRWIPNFDPNQIVRNAWGALRFTFIDCNHGTVDFNSVIGYGAGSMNLTRLTQPAGLTCP